MYNQLVFDFEDDENDPRYCIRHEVSESAPQDNTVVVVNHDFAENKGIELDDEGFPILESLEAWHRKHNPQLFTE